MSQRCNERHLSNAQPMREQNIHAIKNYFLGGIKQADRMGSVGIELEHIIVHDDLSPVSYSGPDGVAVILDEFSSDYPLVTRDAEGDIVGVSRPGESITIEPAAQIELSAGPFADLRQAHSAYSAFERQLNQKLKSIGAIALATGYHPSTKALDLELIPKRRYEFMNAYLSKTDTCGPCMMRGSASTQVAIDYTSEKDCLLKLRLAFALTPILSLICDNSPVFEGSPRTNKLVRTHIWNHMDADRSGLVPGVFSDGFSLEDYAAYILDKPAILVKNKATSEWVSDDRSFGEIYAESSMDHEDISHALSMFFTDVRLKTYIEIRPADALPVPFAIAYAALIKGLFYSDENLKQLDSLFQGIAASDFDNAKTNLMSDGYQALVYGRPAFEWCDEIMQLGFNGLKDDERDFLKPLQQLVSQRITLADISERSGFFKASLSDDDAEELIEQHSGKEERADAEQPLPDNTNKMVTVTFRGFFDDGHTFLDQTQHPIDFPCIQGWMPPEIIDAVTTMRPGETRITRAEASSIYEKRSSDKIIAIERSKLPADMTFETGAVVHLENADGQTYPARVLEQNESHVTFDTNHDAVGKALNFQITLHAVNELR